MTRFLTIQNSYTDIQLALFEGTKIVDSTSANKIAASRMLIPLAASLLSKNQIPLSQLKFIAANMGPGPFTTLRAVLASVNGLAFATGLPLIGVDALDAMASESLNKLKLSDPVRSEALRDHPERTPFIALLNAFSQDVYFAISHNNQTHRGCQKIQTLISELAITIPTGPLQFVGNGTSLHKDLIIQTFGARALISDPILEAPSIETVGLMALDKWQRQEDLVGQLMPIYLK